MNEIDSNYVENEDQQNPGDLYEFSDNLNDFQNHEQYQEQEQEPEKEYDLEQNPHEINNNYEEAEIEEIDLNNANENNLSNNYQIHNNIENNNNNLINNNENTSMNNSVYLSKSIMGGRIKPNTIRLINAIFYNQEIMETILNYLNLIEISQIRGINHDLLFLVHEYYKKRVKFEIDYITNYQNCNKEKVSFFMKNIDSQIPLSNKGWLDFNLNSVANKLLILNRNLLTKLRSIKNIGKYTDLIYAPFCIIFGSNKSNNRSLKSLSWKKIADKILSDSSLIIKIQNLDLENMIDSEMLEAFVFLNLPELEINNIKRFSSDFAKLIIWCQGVVSYHILIHPYNYRNDQGIIKPNSEVYFFAKNMQIMIDKFYHFKRFLFSLNIMKIPLADYVFNLQHNRDNNLLIPNQNINYFNFIDQSLIANILSYIPYNKSYKLMSVSKKFYSAFKLSIDILIFEIIKEIYFFRFQSYDKMINKIPMLYSHNIFSKFFLMIDDILNSNCKNDSNNDTGMSFYPFLSKEQLNNLKTLKIKNAKVNAISEIFCLICNLKPLKKINNKSGEFSYNYVDVIKSLAIKGELMKTMRNVNKLYFTQKKIAQINESLKYFNNNYRLIEIKNINHGIYQLLIWELFVLKYLKLFNIFDFLNIDYYKNLCSQEEIDSIKYFIEIMDYLKYHLKVRFYFSREKNNKNSFPSFGYMKFIELLINFLERQNLIMNCENILKSINDEWEQIGNSYFESKQLIPFKSKPLLYEKIIYKILSTPEIEINQENNNDFNQINNLNNNENLILNNEIINKYNNNYYLEQKPILNNNNYNMFQNEDYISLNNLPNDIIIRTILFYLDINNLPIISLINRKFLSCVKIHIFIRIYFLNKEKQLIEEQHKAQFDSITMKRNQFFAEYEMSPPTKDHAFSLMNLITTDDILELKQCFRRYNKMYEKVIIPFLCLLGEKPLCYVKPDGSKKISYYDKAKNILFKPDFIKRIRNLELETLPHTIFSEVEQKLKDDTFLPKNIQSLSPCFSKLILWVSGVIEFHKVIRKYSLSDYDYEILDQNEIEFCVEMDNIILLYYKLLRYATNYCKDYENQARAIMEEMNILI